MVRRHLDLLLTNFRLPLPLPQTRPKDRRVSSLNAPAYVWRFLNAVYPERAELAVLTFTEKEILEEATRLIESACGPCLEHPPGEVK